MKFQSRRAVLCAMGTMILCLLGTTWARSQSANAGTDQKPQMSEEAFKNIQVLRGIPVNEFMGTMGFLRRFLEHELYGLPRQRKVPAIGNAMPTTLR